ncbi:Ribonuclease H-like domain,Transposase, Tc1-like [Cinara cedri]|uniref:Ribonuclease H-like domain,Transposase, Tc1-like n=1 Tax=Cinara cedri TaxID=506608 RepID=A0A5E4NCB3_9HEMI|nr:Ribonuclease H-like domain,Transposase, Tc1-like [Cinara cedri]
MQVIHFLNIEKDVRRQRCTTDRDDRFIVSTSLRNRFSNAVELQQQLRAARSTTVSTSTVRRRLGEQKIVARRPATGPKLTAQHRKERLHFAREHFNWTLDQWKTVLFSDETRVCLYSNDKRRKVYRRQGERFAQACTEETVEYGGGSCMFWGGISIDSKTELVCVSRTGGARGQGSLTSDRYITEILEEHVVPYAGFVGDGFILMHDNARSHTALIVKNYTEEVGIPVMNWPARSPDLNPIEHLWDELKRRVRSHDPAPTTLQDLQYAVVAEWVNIPQERIVRLITSMKDRMEAVIKARGSSTRF